MNAVRAAVIEGIFFGTAPRERCAFAWGGGGRWLLWLRWPWSDKGWALASRETILAGYVPGAWEIVRAADAPFAIVRAYEEAAERWSALGKGRI